MPRRSKTILFLMNLIKNRYFLIPAARGSRLALAPTLKNDTFPNEFNQKSILFRSRPLAGVAWRSPWRSKSILFLMSLIQNRYFSDPGRSRESSPAPPSAQKSIHFLMNLMKNRYFSDPGRSQDLPAARLGAQNRYFFPGSCFIFSAVREIQNEVS